MRNTMEIQNLKMNCNIQLIKLISHSITRKYYVKFENFYFPDICIMNTLINNYFCEHKYQLPIKRLEYEREIIIDGDIDIAAVKF